MPQLTYVDVPLLLPDPAGELSRWIDKSLPIEDVRLFPHETIWGRTNRFNARVAGPANATAGVEVPHVNWPDPPTLKVNTLYVPTGASRWSVGMFLVDQAGMEKMGLAETANWGKAGRLVLDDWSGDFWPLQPRPLTSVDGNQVYLLPLVDERYWWQFVNAGELEVTDSTTWQDLITTLTGKVLTTALTITDISDDYGRPDPVELTRRHENVAVLLDAVAFSVGRRWVFAPLNSVLALQTTDLAETAFQENLTKIADTYFVAGGGMVDGSVPNALADSQVGAQPASVDVVFPKIANGSLDDDGDVYKLSAATPSWMKRPTQSKAVKTIFSTAYADFTGGLSAADNETDLQKLADIIADDYYAWNAVFYDAAFPGQLLWTPTGYDDYVLHCYGHQEEYGRTTDAVRGLYDLRLGDYQFYTRVASLPWDAGVSTMLQQFKSVGQGGKGCLYDGSGTVSAASISSYPTPWEENATAGAYSEGPKSGICTFVTDSTGKGIKIGTAPTPPEGTVTSFGSGSLVITFATAHGLSKGMKVDIKGSGGTHLHDCVITAVDELTFTATYTGTDPTSSDTVTVYPRISTGSWRLYFSVSCGRSTNYTDEASAADCQGTAAFWKSYSGEVVQLTDSEGMHAHAERFALYAGNKLTSNGVTIAYSSDANRDSGDPSYTGSQLILGAQHSAFGNASKQIMLELFLGDVVYLRLRNRSEDALPYFGATLVVQKA